MKHILAAVALAAVFESSTAATPAVLSWSFDEGFPAEAVGTVESAVGVKAGCWLFDGLTTHLTRPAARVPQFTDGFTVSAWVALGAYPLHRAPVVDLLEPERGGWFFGIDAHGRTCLGIRAGERVRWLTAPDALPLRGWHHIAGTWQPGEGLKLFLNGRLLAEQAVAERMVPPSGLDLLLGRSRAKAQPEGAIRPDANAEVFAFLDGALDEVRIVGRTLTDRELGDEFRAVSPPSGSPLPPRVLPAGPSGNFGAFYTKLAYHPQWDNPWRVGGFPDVVVRFGELPFRCVFWRGTSYIPCWVTENGIWYTNEFNETWTGVKGCGEPMSDKQTRYSHVRVIESSPARCVVHWRYALADVFYQIARTDPATGWGDWSDEVHTIYPDGTSVRDITLHSSNPEQPHEWQESIVVMGQGFSPENSIEPAGLTLVDAAGVRVDYSWEQATPPGRPGKPEHPCIQVVNTKSRHRPFAILRPQDRPSFDIYSGESRRDVSMYPWWNHWPAGSVASDGRYAMAADRASHSSLSHLFWAAFESGPRWMRKIMLAGMTDQPAEKLLPLMRSWSKPAELKPGSGDFSGLGYDPAQKAHLLKCGRPGATLRFTLAASAESPLVNPALVILGWGAKDAKLLLDGTPVARGDALRLGHRQTLDGEDLVVWLKAESIEPLDFVIEPE